MATAKVVTHRDRTEASRKVRRLKAVSAAAQIIVGNNPGNQWLLADDHKTISMLDSKGTNRVYDLVKFQKELEEKVSNFKDARTKKAA